MLQERQKRSPEPSQGPQVSAEAASHVTVSAPSPHTHAEALNECNALYGTVLIVLVLCAQQVLFPPTLTARQRALLHEVAESNGVAHASAGEGAERRFRLGGAAAATVSTRSALGNIYLRWYVLQAEHNALCHAQASAESILQSISVFCISPPGGRPQAQRSAGRTGSRPVNLCRNHPRTFLCVAKP